MKYRQLESILVNMTDEELDEMSDPYERDIGKDDVENIAELLKMPSKKTKDDKKNFSSK